jgi:hypothetical protein
MVNPTPNASVLVFISGFCVLLALIFVGIAHVSLTGGLDSPGSGFILLLVVFTVLCVLMAIASAWGARFWHRLERRRQAAARGDSAHAFLAVGQLSSAPQLPPPRTIRIRMRLQAKLTILGPCVMLAIGILAIGLTDLGGFNFIQRILMCAAFGFMATSATRDQLLDVSNSGITVRVFGIRRTVFWEEARLFAAFRGKGAPSQYELSSAADTVMWMWVRPGTMSARFYEPTMAYGEYDLRMEAMLAFIAAKTALPLYDLR